MSYRVEYRHRRSRGGIGLIGLLLAALIVAYMVKNGMIDLGGTSKKTGKKPAADARTIAPGIAAAAGKSVFKTTAGMVKKAVSSFEMQQSRKPKDLAELHRMTGLDLRKDPWGGHYYVKKGWLRCTGNEDIYEKVW